MNKITTNFTAIPESWMKRADIRPPFKLIMGRLFTLSNIDNAEPEISASGLAEQTGLSWDSADRAIKKLERAGVLNFKESRRKAGGYPFKVHTINRPKLMAFLEVPASADGGRSSASGGCSHPLAADMASARSGLKEEEKECTIKNVQKKGHPEKTKAPKHSPVIEEFLSKSPREQVEWLDAIEADKTMPEDLRAGKDVKWTKAFAEHFANM